MLAFDIETTGLNKQKNEVTVVCMYGQIKGENVQLIFNFARDGVIEHSTKCREALANADILCAMNGLRFDIPFLAHFLQVPEAESLEWMCKLRDPCEVKKNKEK